MICFAKIVTARQLKNTTFSIYDGKQTYPNTLPHCQTELLEKRSYLPIFWLNQELRIEIYQPPSPQRKKHSCKQETQQYDNFQFH